MTVSLYRAAHDVQQRISLCVDEDGILDTDRLDMIEATFQERAVAVVAVYKGKGHTIETLKSYLAEIQDKIKREETNQARLKDYLQACMIMTGTESIKSDDGLLTATLFRDRDESVEIDEGAEFPAALCVDPKPPAPSKTKIRVAILAGQPVSGARIVRKDRLVIK
jgi:hypothetical protein